ncbi:NifB/NifX family molybdenum-iron cluster-binding protein [Sulfurospirillum arcachonense]|uniref:NifB/NifX family molybdenum-iron cluster-binding protein n=1 Tax=Sulfurospirillum arcachonense TaxID=57666 RepID=UPI000468B154|nr:NifB/NifX family molybdenum-iron cluster-binding protein [Sulfurospirillum arcachonense]
MIISFASLDGINVNEHFGWCERFYMYEVNENDFSLIKEIDSSIKHDDEIDKLEYKINCLENSDMVCVSQIGPKAANLVQKCGIYPMKSSDDTIEGVLKSLQNMIKDNPPLWLQRILLRKH